MSTQLLDRLRRQVESLGKRFWHEWLTDDERATAVNFATQGLQKGKQVIDQNSAKLLTALNLATQDDVRRIYTKAGRLRKRIQNLKDKQNKQA